MDDTIETILKKLRDDAEVRKTRFTSNFLNNVREVLDYHGFGATKVFLLDKLDKKDSQWQAQTLLKRVIPLLEASDKIRTQPSIGAYIIKSLNAIKEVEL